MGRKILFFVRITYQALLEKGVERLLLERDENGYFDRVITAHFPAPQDRKIILSERHQVLEYKGLPGRPLRGLLRWWSPLHSGFLYVRFLYKVLRIAREERVHVIRAIDPFDAGFSACLVSKVLGIPWCVSVHADHDLRFRLGGRRGVSLLILRCMRRLSLTFSARIFVIRESLRPYVLKHGARGGRVRVFPHGIDLGPYRESKETGVDKVQVLHAPDGGSVLFVGRLTRDNYVFDVLEIGKKVVQTENACQFIVVGGGKETEMFQQRVAEEGLQDNIRCLGFQPPEVVRHLRRRTDIALCLMGGYSLIEAAASGRPIVSYAVEWHDEVVEDGQTGFLVPERDVNGAATAILRLLADRGLASRMGQKARAVAFERFSLEAASRVRLECYRELLGES